MVKKLLQRKPDYEVRAALRSRKVSWGKAHTDMWMCRVCTMCNGSGDVQQAQRRV